MIGSGERDGIPTLTISSADDSLEAAFAPGAGMVCCSLLAEGEEVLGQRHGLRGYVEQRSTMGVPLLYPWANRLGADRFAVGGAEVDLGGIDDLLKRDDHGLPIHGLLTAYEGWEVVEHGEGAAGGVLAAELEWERDPRLLRAFPFPHRLRLRAEISGLELALTTTVVAGELPTPIAFGFHPYLCPPGPRARWELELPLPERLPLDERGLPSGSAAAAGRLDGALGERTFDDLFRSARSGALRISAAGRTLSIAMDGGYPFTQLYAPAAEELFAIEPMTAPTNALLSGEGLRIVPPGESFSARFAIAVAGRAS